MYDQEELKKIPGVKIRRQYCRSILYWGMIVLGMGLTFICLFGPYSIENLKYILLCVFIFLIAMIPVFLNRFFLGEIICVINEEGLYYYHGFIEWKAIESVEFDIEMKGRAPTTTSIYVMGKKGKPQIVYNAPYFALRKMKKFKSSIEVAFTERGKGNLVISIVVAGILALILPLSLFLLSL